MRFRPWTEEEIALLHKLRAVGASPGRVSAAVKKSQERVKTIIRELGISFEASHVERRLRKEKERAARVAAGCQRNPRCALFGGSNYLRNIKRATPRRSGDTLAPPLSVVPLFKFRAGWRPVAP